MAVCRACRTPNEAGASYCFHCGAELPATDRTELDLGDREETGDVEDGSAAPRGQLPDVVVQGMRHLLSVIAEGPPGDRRGAARALAGFGDIGVASLMARLALASRTDRTRYALALREAAREGEGLLESFLRGPDYGVTGRDTDTGAAPGSWSSLDPTTSAACRLVLVGAREVLDERLDDEATTGAFLESVCEASAWTVDKLGLRTSGSLDAIATHLAKAWAVDPDAGPSIPASVEAALVAALFRAGEGGAARVAGLLGHDDARVRERSLASLDAAVVSGARVADLVSGALGDESARVRAAAVRALTRSVESRASDDVVRQLLDATKDEDPTVQSAARWGLDATDGIAEADLLRALDEADEHSTKEVVEALGNVRAPSSAATTRVVDLLGSEDLEVRRTTARTVSRMGGPAVEEVAARLASTSAEQRRAAAWFFAERREGDEAVVRSLLDLLEDSDAGVSRHARLGLLRRSDAARSVIADRLRALGSDPDGSGSIGSCARAVEILGIIACRDRGALDPLRAALRLCHEEVRLAAARALSRIEPDGIVALAEALVDETEEVRAEAAWSLRAAGESSATVVGVLGEVLDGADDAVALQAASVLRDIGGAAAPALGALIRASRERENDEVRQAALAAIGAVGQASRSRRSLTE